MNCRTSPGTEKVSESSKEAKASLQPPGADAVLEDPDFIHAAGVARVAMGSENASTYGFTFLALGGGEEGGGSLSTPPLSSHRV